MYINGGMPTGETNKIAMLSTNYSIDQIPEEVIRIIYMYLDFSTICHLSEVGKNIIFASLSTSNEYWRERHDQVFAKVDYIDIGNAMRRDETSLTNYRDSLLKLRKELKIISIQMSKQRAELNSYIHENVNLVTYGDYLHGYIGISRINEAFDGITNPNQLIAKFGIKGIDISYGSSRQKIYGSKVVVVGDGAGKYAALSRFVFGLLTIFCSWKDKSTYLA